MNIRFIPRLDIKGPNLVKGIHLEGLRVMGKPEVFAKHYYESGADELMFVDVVASLYERNSLHDIVAKTAKEIFIPLTVGGGIRTISDIKNILRAGADKVSLNTAAIKNPSIIKEAALKFGSSTIVVTIEATKETNGQYLAYTDNGREYTGVDVFEWAKKVEELGAGEIVITSVDREGTGEGFDIELVQKVASLVSIPVIAHGGAGRKEDVVKVVKQGQASAVSVASILHYEFLRNNTTSSATDAEGNVEFLNAKRKYHTFDSCTIQDIKKHMIASGVPCRP